MDNYEMEEQLEGAKINFNNSKQHPVFFDLAMGQLQDVIDALNDAIERADDDG